MATLFFEVLGDVPEEVMEKISTTIRELLIDTRHSFLAYTGSGEGTGIKLHFLLSAGETFASTDKESLLMGMEEAEEIMKRETPPPSNTIDKADTYTWGYDKKPKGWFKRLING